MTRRTRPLFLASGLALLLSAACSFLVSVDGLDDGPLLGDSGSNEDRSTNNATLDASLDASADVRLDGTRADSGDAGDAGKGTDGGCPGTSGPQMVDVGGYCIDSTEVTRGQYNLFLLSSPSIASQPPECGWNTTYLPSPFDLSQPNYPVTYVDWCDAHAYCAWAGKRLCGKIDGGALPFGAAVDPTQSQWYRACSNSGTLTYPYGNSYDAGACNGAKEGGAPAAVGSFSQCVGGHPGLFDMAGNVEEWQDSCQGDSGATDLCREQAGSFLYLPPASTSANCMFLDSDVRTLKVIDIGIRCCAP